MSKKRFSSMSNIDVIKKYLAGERPYLTISYNQSEKDKYRNEGDEWKVDGKCYKKVDGKTVCLTKTQGDIIREAIGNEMDCKKCHLNYKWGNKQDQKILRKSGLCTECFVEFDTKLRILGIYPDYEQYHLASHELGFLKEAREKIKETIDYFNRTGGDVTKISESEYDPNIVWKNTNKDKMLNDATIDLEKVEALIVTGSLVTDGLKNQYLNAVKKYDLGSYV
jgi:hypothetical protein